MNNVGKQHIRVIGGGAPDAAHFEPYAPVVYNFDFIDGAAVIVLFPKDEEELLTKPDLRVWAAEYITGYCAFWHVEGCDWLREVLPRIREGETSEEACKTAAYMCARIVEDIAASRDVRRYPRFYLCRNLQ